MTDEEIIERMLYASSRNDGHLIRGGYWDPQGARGRFEESRRLFWNLPLHVDGRRHNILQLISVAKQMCLKRKNVGLILMDYLQLVLPAKQTANQDRDIDSVVVALKDLAKSVNVPVVVASQLNRNSENRSGHDKGPRLQDLRSGGNQEAHADIVVLIDNPPPTDDAARQQPRDAIAVIARATVAVES